MQIKARKPSWQLGSSFALKKKPTKILPKVQIDEDMDLIDEDSLLTEEDLKKPQLPPGKTMRSSLSCFEVNSLIIINTRMQLVTVKLEVQGKPAKIALVAGLRQRRKCRS